MTNPVFLDRLASVLITNHLDNLSEITIVLPNKRARIFLIEALKKQITTNVFAPQIISIEEFVQEIAGIRSIDSIELLFEFYEVYLKITDADKQQSFELFANWAKTLLQDFNEVDRYLLDPSRVLAYLKDIEDIKHWALDLEKRTTLIENHLQFWELLPNYYGMLYEHLLSQGIGYQGLIYREAVKNINHFSGASDKFYVFGGFNALNAAEEQIIQHLLAVAQAEIYWDIDEVFLDDRLHDAGLFIRRFKETWPYYKSNNFRWIASDFNQPKQIKVIGTPKTIGQAKIAGSVISQIIEDEPGAKLDRVAIVLGEENMLIPLLYALPAKVGALNITMGYAGKNNPAQILIAKLFRLHTKAIGRNAASYVLYYKDVLDVLTHPLIEPYVDAADLINLINRNNYTFIPHSRLMELNLTKNRLFLLLFGKWDDGSSEVIKRLSEILLAVKHNLSGDNGEDKIAKAFVYSVYKVVNKIASYYSRHPNFDNIETLNAIYKQVIDLAEVSFEGEPLNGLQVMGVLESRVLDFDTVIVTSMNEGNFPAGKSQNSFIPYDVKRELGLPTFKEKDAIYTYHFYHLLQRAKNVYLLYNTESEGLDAGERSRFITQLEVEKQPLHELTQEIYNAGLPSSAYKPIVIPKSEKVMLRLHEIADDGFSPSALTSYIRNPIDFYFRKILRISEADEVEENIALNTLGTIIHESLRSLYQPFIGRVITAIDLESCLDKMDDEVLFQFKQVYKEGEIKKGRNLLAFEVAKRNVLNFLKMELSEIKSGDVIKLLFLEERFERTLEHPELPFPIKIGGSVDRIEERNGIIRIIDYKTGKVNANDICLKQWNGLLSEAKTDKIIQLLAYGFMFAPQLQGRAMEAGIISFKNMKCGFMPFTLKEEKVGIKIINAEILQSYIGQLVVLLKEILDAEIPFTEKIN
ncbi:MAG TPA: PD-(D/E)XK nuclease family protein [Flavobacterium sp.]|jgi:hypothetical protein